MREILFKGKCIDNGEWVYGNLIRNFNGTSYIRQIAPPYNMFLVVPETVGQYTGCKDKCNVRLFETEIVSTADGNYLIVCENLRNNFK